MFFAILCSAIIVGWCIPGISRVEGNGIFIQLKLNWIELEYIITHCSSYHDLTKHFIIKTICVYQNEWIIKPFLYLNGKYTSFDTVNIVFCLLWTIYHLSKLSIFNLSEVSPGIINRDIGYCYLSLALFVHACLWLRPWPHSFHAVAFGFDTVKVRYLSWSIDI